MDREDPVSSGSHGLLHIHCGGMAHSHPRVRSHILLRSMSVRSIPGHMRPSPAVGTLSVATQLSLQPTTHPMAQHQPRMRGGFNISRHHCSLHFPRSMEHLQQSMRQSAQTNVGLHPQPILRSRCQDHHCFSHRHIGIGSVNDTDRMGSRPQRTHILQLTLSGRHHAGLCFPICHIPHRHQHRQVHPMPQVRARVQGIVHRSNVPRGGLLEMRRLFRLPHRVRG